MAIVKFAQGANGEVSFKDFAVDASGNWGGSFTIPYAATGAAQLTGDCFDATHAVQTTLAYQSVDFTVTPDSTPPLIMPRLAGTRGNNGWYTSNVAVTWSVSDAESAIISSSGCDPSTVITDTAASGVSLTCTATSSGGTASKTVTVKRDATAPTVAYSGNPGSYTVDQTVAINCTAADPTPGSGLASTTCSNVTGPAWSFGLGTTTRSASATDLAGNTGTGSTSFTVVVTSASLDRLITQFFGGDRNGANGLISKANAIVTAPNANAKNGKLRAFDNQVDAKAGNPLTPAQAALLKQLAASL